MEEYSLDEIRASLRKHKWEVETWFLNDLAFVANRGYSTIIGYATTNRYRENGVVSGNLTGRLKARKRAEWFSEQLTAKNEWIAELLENEKSSNITRNPKGPE